MSEVIFCVPKDTQVLPKGRNFWQSAQDQGSRTSQGNTEAGESAGQVPSRRELAQDSTGFGLCKTSRSGQNNLKLPSTHRLQFSVVMVPLQEEAL